MHPSLSSEKPGVFSRELTDATVMEGEDLTLVCETAALDNPVCWTKDGKALRPSARCRLSYEGRRAQLVITDTTLQDGGRYKCEAGGAWSSSVVRVHGEPLEGGAGQPPAALWAPLFLVLLRARGTPGLYLTLSISALYVCVCVWGCCSEAPSVHLYLSSSSSNSLCSLLPISGSLMVLIASLTLPWSSDQQSLFYFIPSFVLCSDVTVSPFSWLGSSPSVSVSSGSG